MKNKEASIWGWAETNVNWTLSLVSQANYIGRRIHKKNKCVATSSNEEASYKQMEDTCTARSGTINAQQQRLLTMKEKPDAKVRKEWDKNIPSLIK
eukprot:13435312-Ditylum_brightwellii.AAC.1